MKKDAYNIVGIDCGNSSVRIVLGRHDGDGFSVTSVSQTPHREILVNGVWHWDILFIFERIREGLKKAHTLAGHIHSAGISTWGIDHGLLGENGLLLANPFCYRNHFGQAGLAPLSDADRRFMFDETGIQCDKINSVFQMLGYRDVYPAYWRSARDILLIPDLLNYFLTGEKNTDVTITSTTQLFDMRHNRYSASVLERFGLDGTLFPLPVPHGEQRGTLRPDIAEELGVNRFPIVSVPSHDTAAAVLAAPANDPNERPLFISSGTWSLVGTELPEPLIGDRVYASGLANEGGALGTVTLLKNSAGLFMAQRLKKEVDIRSGARSWDDIAAGAEGADGDFGLVDPNAAEFFNPASMKGAIREAVERAGGKVPATDDGYFRVVYESLAKSYQRVIADIEAVTGKRFETVNVIGGGSRNELLNRLTARATGKRVVAGPTEATSLGTLGAQLLFGGIASDLAGIRRIVSAAEPTSVFTP